MLSLPHYCVVPLACSYYTRQLALREQAGAGRGELQQEGEKSVQASVARRTIDYAGPYISWFEVGPGRKERNEE